MTVVQGLVEPCDQRGRLWVLDPDAVTAIHGEVVVTVQFQHDIGKLTTQALTALSSTEELLDGKELTATILWHLHR